MGLVALAVKTCYWHLNVTLCLFIDGPVVQPTTDENDYPTVSLQEMLQDLSIKDDVEMTEE